MTRSVVRLLPFGFGVLLAACGAGADANQLCARQRDNDQRCNPTQSACAREASYNDCIAANSLYRPELSSAYLSCYSATLGCDSAAQMQAQACAQAAANQVPVGAALTTLANNICQRCPSAGKDNNTDAAACVTGLTSNASDLARALRYYNDQTLGTLNTCLVGASPPADGCVSLGACFQKVVPVATDNSCGAGT